jgi:hypothetical protein
LEEVKGRKRGLLMKTQDKKSLGQNETGVKSGGIEDNEESLCL